MNRPHAVETFQAYLRRHIANRTGHPEAHDLVGTPGDRAYKKHLREKLGGGSDSTFRRWLKGETVPWADSAQGIAAALGYAGEALESETKLLQRILRAAHGEAEPEAVAESPSTTESIVTESPAQPAAAPTPQANMTIDVSLLSRARRRAIEALAEPNARPLAARIAAVVGWSAVGDQPLDVGQAAALLAKWIKSAEPMDTVTEALEWLRRHEIDGLASMPPPEAQACARASTHLYALALYSAAVHDSADLSGNAVPALFVRLPRALEAALILDDALNGVFDFEVVADRRSGREPAENGRTGPRYRPRARAKYYLDESDQPASDPGRQVDAQKSDVAARQAAYKSHIADLLDLHYDDMLGQARDARCEVPDDDQLRELIRDNDRRNLPVIRFSVSLDHPDAQHRLQIAEALRKAGVATVAYSESKEPPPGFVESGRATGQPDPKTEQGQAYRPVRAFDVAVERFLKARDALGIPPTAQR